MTDEKSIEARAPMPKADLAEVSLICVVGVGAVGASLAVAPSWAGVAGAALALSALAIAIVDRRSFIIPDPLNALALIVGILALGLRSEASEAIVNALISAAIMLACFSPSASVTETCAAVTEWGSVVQYGYNATPGAPIGTGALVPEPATWVMMIVGLGAMGALTRFRKPSSLKTLRSLSS